MGFRRRKELAFLEAHVVVQGTTEVDQRGASSQTTPMHCIALRMAVGFGGSRHGAAKSCIKNTA